MRVDMIRGSMAAPESMMHIMSDYHRSGGDRMQQHPPSMLDVALDLPPPAAVMRRSAFLSTLPFEPSRGFAEVVGRGKECVNPTILTFLSSCRSLVAPQNAFDMGPLLPGVQVRGYAYGCPILQYGCPILQLKYGESTGIQVVTAISLHHSLQTFLWPLSLFVGQNEVQMHDRAAHSSVLQDAPARPPTQVRG